MEWRPIVGWEADYIVSEQGDVRRTTRGQGTWAGRILNPSKDYKGYLYVRLPGKRCVRIHQIVAKAFHGDNADLMVRHLDGNQLNNHHSNLKWGTALENSSDRILHGRATGWHSRQTECLRGHPFSEENTRLKKRADGRVERVCRTCHRASRQRPKLRT